MFTYRPKLEKKNALYFTFTMFALTAVCILSGYADFAYSGIFQIFGLITLTAGIFVTYRYLLTTYRYYVDYENEVLSLGVEKTQGKKITIAASIAVSSIKRVEKLSSDKKCEKQFEKDYGRIVRKFNFCQNLFTAEKICVMLEFNGDYTVIYLEGDNILADKIRSLALSAKNENE